MLHSDAMFSPNQSQFDPNMNLSFSNKMNNFYSQGLKWLFITPTSALFLLMD